MQDTPDSCGETAGNTGYHVMLPGWYDVCNKSPKKCTQYDLILLCFICVVLLSDLMDKCAKSTIFPQSYFWSTVPKCQQGVPEGYR